MQLPLAAIEVVNLVAVCGVAVHPVEADFIRIYIPMEFDCLAADEAVFDCRLGPQAWKAPKDCVQGGSPFSHHLEGAVGIT